MSTEKGNFSANIADSVIEDALRSVQKHTSKAPAEEVPVEVEAQKPERELGYYIHPELYGAPEEKGIEWARHPQLMKRMRERSIPPHPATRPAPCLPIRSRALVDRGHAARSERRRDGDGHDEVNRADLPFARRGPESEADALHATNA